MGVRSSPPPIKEIEVYSAMKSSRLSFVESAIAMILFAIMFFGIVYVAFEVFPPPTPTSECKTVHQSSEEILHLGTYREVRIIVKECG